MKTILALALVLAAGNAFALESAETAVQAKDSYASALKLRDLRINQMQTLLGEFYQKTGNKILLEQILVAWNTIDGASVRVKTTFENLENQIALRRERYLKILRELPVQTPNSNLRKDIADDLKFVKATSDLNLQEFSRALKHYEGANFGRAITEQKQLAGIEIRASARIKVRTYHSQTEVTIKPGDSLRITTTAGEFVWGKVVGTLPQGEIVIQVELPFGLESDLPEIARGRIISLNAAADVKLYAVGSERPIEITVRYQAKDIKEANCQFRLLELARRSKANGEIAEIQQVKPTILDKRMGEWLSGNGSSVIGR